MKPDGSQDSATEQIEFSPHSHTLYPLNIILTSMPSSRKWSLPFRLPCYNLYAFLAFSMRATSQTDLIIPDLESTNYKAPDWVSSFIMSTDFLQHLFLALSECLNLKVRD